MAIFEKGYVELFRSDIGNVSIEDWKGSGGKTIMGFKTYMIKNLFEYINLLEELHSPNQTLWFRGQSCADYRLIPSALRNTYAIEDSRGNKIEKPYPDRGDSGSNNVAAFLPVDKMVKDFKDKAEKYIDYNADNDIEWECIAQHYGIPTRLLDWTTSPLDALYFAVNDCRIGEVSDEEIERFMQYGFSSAGGAVFIINPIEINALTVPFKDNVAPFVLDPIANEETIRQYLNSMLPPLCMKGFNKEKRICRQSGNFTTTGTLLWPFDYYEELQRKMTKVLIPYSIYEKLRTQLSAMGFTHEAIYVEPDEKDIIAEKIAQETKNRFEQIMNAET